MFKCNIHGIEIEMPFPYDTDSGEKFGILQCYSHLNEGILKGGWEQCERDRINRFLPDADLIEFGAGTGFLSCFSNKKLNNKKHVSFEANPLLIPIIKHNRDINGCNFEVVNKAYHGTDKIIDYLVTTPYDNIVSLPQPVTFRVESLNLSDVIRDYGFNEYSLLMDIEGYEIGLVGEAEALKKCNCIVLEHHRSGFEAGHRGFNDSIDVSRFLLDNGFVMKDKCGCANWIGVYGR